MDKLSVFFGTFDPNHERHQCSKFREGVPTKPRNVPRSFCTQMGLAFPRSGARGPQIPGKQFQTMQIQIDALLLKAEERGTRGQR